MFAVALALLLIEVQPAPPPDLLADWRKVIVRAIRNCPEPKEGDIVVCAKDVGEAPPAYRYPRLDRRFAGSADDAHRLPARPGSEAGASGIGSCSAVGAGGATGCGLSAADNWKQGQLRDRAEGWRP